MNFNPLIGPDDPLWEAAQRMDAMVDTLTRLDHQARLAVMDENPDVAGDVSEEVSRNVAGITWGMTPTLIMHLAHHVNLARNEAHMAVASCTTAGNALRLVAGEMARMDDMPVELTANLMDLATQLLEVEKISVFEHQEPK